MTEPTPSVVDIATEQAQLGWMLCSPTGIANAIYRALSETDFRIGGHGAIFRAVMDIHARGEVVDPVTVCAELEERGELEAVGGPAYMVTLTATYDGPRF
ncbi:DnaB-like helicase N-terminal domain-containing protein [Nocardia sp. NPDC057227]|uniref:DnaB-like helicase N-terminal domain-containing protein n=1 Tax=Nocardia sp. NPDC057227 TaxID=3346056 RepID=UPI00364113D8